MGIHHLSYSGNGVNIQVFKERIGGVVQVATCVAAMVSRCYRERITFLFLALRRHKCFKFAGIPRLVFRGFGNPGRPVRVRQRPPLRRYPFGDLADRGDLRCLARHLGTDCDGVEQESRHRVLRCAWVVQTLLLAPSRVPWALTTITIPSTRAIMTAMNITMRHQPSRARAAAMAAAGAVVHVLSFPFAWLLLGGVARFEQLRLGSAGVDKIGVIEMVLLFQVSGLLVIVFPLFLRQGSPPLRDLFANLRHRQMRLAGLDVVPHVFVE